MNINTYGTATLEKYQRYQVMADTDIKGAAQIDALDKSTSAEDQLSAVKAEKAKPKQKVSKSKAKSTSSADKKPVTNKSEIASLIDPFQSVRRVWPD